MSDRVRIVVESLGWQGRYCKAHESWMRLEGGVCLYVDEYEDQVPCRPGIAYVTWRPEGDDARTVNGRGLSHE